MNRSILPSFLRRESPSGRLSASSKRPGGSLLPPTPAIDPWMPCGVSLVELARMAQEAAQ